MTAVDLWYVIMGTTAFFACACILIAALACLGAWRTEQREWQSTNRRAGVRRMLARLHFLNQRARIVTSTFLLGWAVTLLYYGPPAVFRQATWISISLIAGMAVVTFYSSVREWRIRVIIVRRAAEIDLLEGSPG